MMTMTSTLMKKYTTKTHMGTDIIEKSKNENDGFKKEYAVGREKN